MNPDRQHRMNRSGSPSRREKESTRRDTSNRVSKSSRSRRQPKAVAKNKVAASYVSSDEQARRFVAEEDNFVLRQSKKKAVIRVRERRAQPIDFLAYSLRYVDEEEEMRDVFDGEDGEGDGREDVVDVPDPAAVVQGIWDLGELATLESEIGSYHVLETDGRNREYWEALRSLCEAQRARVDPRGRDRRAVVSGAVAADIDGILAPKTHEELGQLERQIREKLRGAEEGDEDVDTDYWEQLLQSLGVWKAKAVLARTVDKMMKKKAERRSRQVGQEDYAARTGRRNGGNAAVEESVLTSAASGPATATKPAPESRSAPETAPETSSEVALSEPAASTSTSVPAASTLLAPDPNGQTDVSSVTQTLYDREAARGIQDNEEVFAAEEELPVMARPKWAGKHRVRKPRYFNRVQMGYEWNKYNQTHYDHENPPPKVVQGYKFNIFYPELIDKTKAPTFKIIREHGRRRGESFAAAGEEDTCLIRFIAGPPYTDIAFRIVDREWDYSAKRDRGFRSSFDKLHFQFKKIFYRK